MSIQVCSDREGDKIVGPYPEASDPAGRLVVKRVDNRQEAATYLTPVAEAQLNIINA